MDAMRSDLTQLALAVGVRSRVRTTEEPRESRPDAISVSL
jgi:hypothetical protein